MTKEEKLRVARQLERMKVDVIEAGFAAASRAISRPCAIAEAVKESTVCSLARANENDIRRAGEAIKPAAGRIHTFIATSPIHMEKKLRMTPDQVVEQAVKAMRLGARIHRRRRVLRRGRRPLRARLPGRIFEAVIEAGAKTINVPDTVGYNVPEQFADTIRSLRERVPNSDKVVWSVHCHNDLGLAVANSLAAVHGGRAPGRMHDQRPRRARRQRLARRDRHGGAHPRRHLPVETGIDTTQIVPASKLVSHHRLPVQPNKAIVGANAFAHESGIHQDGVLKHRETYEIMRAEDVGWGANKLVLGKLSGRNAFRARLLELGIEIESEEHLNQAFARFKELADRKSEIFDEDLTALMRDEAVTPAPEQYRLVSTRFHSETGETPVAEITLSIGGAEKQARANGSGPVDAAFKAIETVATTGSELLLYSVNAITSGTDAQGEVTVRLSRDGRVVDGQGADTDIIVASAKAYLNALNKLHAGAQYRPAAADGAQREPRSQHGSRADDGKTSSQPPAGLRGPAQLGSRPAPQDRRGRRGTAVRRRTAQRRQAPVGKSL
jgi:2-isopropylmalate synthase